MPDLNLSGATWWHANQANFPNSARVDDLETDFRGKVQSFLAALGAAGAHVTVSATRRNKIRAYLMHHCWDIAHGLESPSAVPAEPGVTIKWDHGNPAQSKAAAQEMVNLFGIAFRPSLTSLHIPGQAIDMTISWSGTLSIAKKAGPTVAINAPHDGSNPKLHEVGASYGIIKLLSDPPHWSFNGH
jgi:hypothetical protein